MEKPKIRFRKFNNKWKKNKLDKVVDFFDNQRIPIDSGERKSGPYPYYGASGIIDYVDGYIFNGEYVLLAEDGANIVLRSSPIAYLSKGKFWLNNHAHIMTMKTGSNEFLIQLLEKQNYEKYNTGTAQPKLNGEVVKNITLHFPSDDEQSAIGTLFQTLDDLLASYKDNLANHQSLKATMLSKMFPKAGQTVPEIRLDGFEGKWEEKCIGELADIVRGASPRPIQDPKWFDSNSEIGWLRISDVTNQNGRIHSLEQKISKLGQEKTRVLTEPHLLLSIAATVGKPVVNYVKTGVHDGFLIFLNPKFDREFMFQWLEMFREKWNRYGQPGSQVNLNSDIVKNQKIFIPSMKEQQAIGSYLSNLDNLINSHQEKISQLETLKKKLLQDMFI